jgi:hypothetical protein
MSGVVKSIGKVFRRVAKAAVRIAPVALAAGALLFTAGSALGVTGGMGWGQATASIGKVFGEGTFANVVTGAVTQAGYGALAGAATAAVSGGDLLQGAQAGALGGAVTGGVMGGMGLGTDPFEDGFGRAAGAEKVAVDPQLTAAQDTSSVGQSMFPNSAKDPGAMSAPDLQKWVSQAPGAPASSSKGLLSSIEGAFEKGGWVERNQGLVGNLVSGVGKGLLSGDSQASVYAKAREDEAKRIADNYRTGTGWMINPTGAAQAQPGSAPRQTAQAPQSATGQLVWDAATQRYVFVPAVPGGVSMVG